MSLKSVAVAMRVFPRAMKFVILKAPSYTSPSKQTLAEIVNRPNPFNLLSWNSPTYLAFSNSRDPTQSEK